MKTNAEMTDEELRILVAECAGWKFSKFRGEFRYSAIAPDGRVFHANFGNVSFIPAFESSLDAMATAEATLADGESWTAYYEALDSICEQEDNDSRSATARQRAIAFIRTRTPKTTPDAARRGAEGPRITP